MARRARKDTATDGLEPTGVSAIRGNGYDAEKTLSYIERLENLDGERVTAHMEYMSICKRIGEDKSAVLEDAKGEGFEKKSLKAKVKERALRRKAEAVREDLEGDTQNNFDLLSKALGDFADTGLGAAALAKTGNGADAHA